ncbi:MAG: hypothetical protein A2252_09390 [Elusimicrobia bacterium RIFOXYA2_FULL_39_19]|nr:MAG: hypothetical protein A2252_09390 [Elusimicrobia bacterium RIFOXYA2_FULL_39_19]
MGKNNCYPIISTAFLFLTLLCVISVNPVTAQNFIDDLRYGSPELRMKAIDTIGRTKESRYIGLLIENFKDPDPGVRTSVIKALHLMQVKSYTDNYIAGLSDNSPEVCEAIRKMLIDFMEPKLLERLKEEVVKNENPQIRQQVAMLFGEAKEKTSVEVLIKALKDNDFIRFAAVKSLGQIGDKTAVSNLISTLSDPLGEVKIQAARSLADLKISNAVPYMFNQLDEKDPAVRVEMEKVLEKFVSKETILYFTEALLKDQRISVRKFSAKALGILGDKSAAPVLFEALKDKDATTREEVMRSISMLSDKTLVFNYCLTLKNKDSVIKTFILTELEKLKDPRALPSLIDALKREKSPEFREMIQKTMMEVADPAVLDVISKGMSDSNLLVRVACVNIAGKLKIKELLPELSKSLKNEKSFELKFAIIATIKNYSDKSVLPELHDALVKEKNIEIKIAIIDALKDFQDYSSIPSLLQCLKVGDEMLRMEAEGLLNKLADVKSVNYFLEAAKDRDLVVRSYAMKVVKEYPTASAVPIALAGLNDKDVYIRLDAVKTLGQIGDKTVIPELAKKLDDNEEEIKIETIKSLAQLGDPAIADYVLKALKDKSAQVRIEAIKLLGTYYDEEMTGDFIKALKKSSEPEVKEQIILVLSKSTDKNAKNILKKTLRDTDPAIRKAVVTALGEMDDPAIIPELKDLYAKEFAGEVRIEIIIALAKLKAREMIPDFINGLYDQSKEFSDASKVALDLVINQSDARYLAATIQNEHKEVRNYCITALTKLNNKECVPELFQTLKNLQGPVRPQVMKLIDTLNDNKTPAEYLSLIEKPSTSNDKELLIWIVRNLARYKDNSAIEYLALSIRNGNDEIRKETVISLNKIGGAKSREILIYVSNNDVSLTLRNFTKKTLEGGGVVK